ncbi:zinc-binding protein A33-like [Conger conger]|uniref:zinc-binding protein A33-like n=1 Tax=Conger conger TaxID=82655 RepID=UPI002A5A0FCE|nr:zinc-binding protein A33-like [Conger conger]
MEAKALIPEEVLICCSVCCDIFKEPVALKCSHSFCRACLQKYWEMKSTRDCPICRGVAPMEDPPVESSLEQKTGRGTVDKSEDHCSLHGEKLLLFCEHDKEPLCVICQSSKKHRNHPVCPLEEAVLDLKEELKPALNLIKQKLEKFTKNEEECQKTAEHIKSQTQHTERQMKAEFEKLHQFLREEEEARVAALQVEGELKGQITEEKLTHIARHISTFTDEITVIETAMNTEGAVFLKSYKNIKERAQCTLQDPELLSGALIDVAKHLGNLKFQVWEMMLGMVQHTPVILDPKTAHPDLSLSDELTTVTFTNTKQKCPDNPERFKCCMAVQGSEGFTSGKHSFEVNVGNKTSWDIGVANKSIIRKSGIPLCPKNGFWLLSHRNGDMYKAGSIKLTLKKKPQTIRVQLNYDRGEVSFFDSSDMAPFHTFTDTFTEGVYPYFSPGFKEDGMNDMPLKIYPANVSVTVTLSE